MIKCEKIARWFYSALTLWAGADTSIAQGIDLQKANWQYKQGDDLAWAQPQFQTQSWEKINVGQPWEGQGHPDYDGIAWYRTAVTVPKEWQKQSRKEGGLVLRLGRIDDADETYFNGQKIGSTGRFPPERVSAWDEQRLYTVPHRLVQWGQENTIAVRVADWGGGGGLQSGDYTFEPASWKDRLKLGIETPATTAVFEANAPVSIRVVTDNRSGKNLKGVMIGRLLSFSGQKMAEIRQDVTLLRGDTVQRTTFQFAALPAGFYAAEIIFQESQGGRLTVKSGFSVAPETLQSPLTRPADFEAYWSKAKAELATVAPDFKLTPLPQLSTDKVAVYELEMRSWGQVRVRGYYTQPRNKTQLPALLHVQGYSSVMAPFALDEDWAGLFLNIRGHGNSRSDVNPGFPGYLFHGIKDKDTYIYKGAYMDCLRAIDFLCSRPEIDTNRLAVEGDSQGGALSVATAALDKRIKLCLPSVPFLSDFRQYFQIAAWPANEFKTYAATHLKSMDSLYGILDYIDIKNLAPDVHCPVLMGVGLFDEVCPPAINFAMYNQLGTQEKAFILYPQAGHSLPGSHYEQKKAWFKRYLKP